MGTLFDNYYDAATGEGEFVLIIYHVSDSYQVPFSVTRANFYGVQYVPSVSFAGDPIIVGAQTYDYYEHEFSAKRALPTDVTIDVAANQVSGWTYRITARVCLEPTGTTKPMKLFMAFLQDHTTTALKHRNTCRSGAQVASFTIVPAQCRVFTYDFNLSVASGAPNNIRMAVWTQSTNAAAPAEVYQARLMSWPFPADCNVNGVPDTRDLDDCDGSPWCSDCNDNGVLDQCDIAAGTSADTNANGIPDECEVACLGDANCDGEVGFADINGFVSAVVSQTFCDGTGVNTDMTQDDPLHVGFEDINPFVEMITTNPLPIACN